ncbi:uncharacterized membrane protein YdcZ (DUF606 family) [Mitsuaria sp. BK045]|uniref:hypothetical protein n=1 Tax=unclassified Roseateles TaxID=2626991 RepID=UPI0017FB9BBA|nr:MULTISPECIES: hypothetical protein [unclassified Roseateles]MBB3291844.1 uncharacterized membrane protein YdcZ (DUF606 family) [Mitsuaria sp. BK041]MBB3361061.1 uncharacterized membrane protein YdcZ (DUF606 family) [Mitsuaria sp. BK045]
MSRPPLARPSRALALSLFAGTSAWAAADTSLADPLSQSLLAAPGAAAVLASVVGLAAAIALYRASSHQRLWPRSARPRRWRCAALALLVVATLLAVPALGVTAAFSVALSAAMLGAVALPFLNAWRVHAQGDSDVG